MMTSNQTVCIKKDSGEIEAVASAASPVEQPAPLTARAALAAIETFEIVGENNDSREPNADDRFILTEFIAHLFDGFTIERPAAAPIDGNSECGCTGKCLDQIGCPSKAWKPAQLAPASTDERAAMADTYPARLLNESDASLAWRVDSWHARQARAASASETAAEGVKLPRYAPGIALDKVRGGDVAVMYSRDDGEYVKLSDVLRSPAMAAEAVAIPADVHAALDRMCSPLDESRLSGLTAQLDANCMKVIRDYVLKTTPTSFQQRVQPWMLACFGATIAADRAERNHRFYEEAGELVQAHGMTREEAHALVDYTWSRPAGDPAQEAGGVMVTLAALCLANGIDMHAAGETELARINVPETIAKIRAKQAAKPKHSPLPVATPTADRESYQWRDTGALETGDA
ncbi:hypothetical protein [Burkholderia sp. YIM B11467]